MKLLLVLMLCLGCAVTVNAQTVSGGGVEMTVGQDPLHAQLQLKTDLIELRHCSVENLRFTLRLNFTNQGKRAVILDKRSSVISQYMVSRSFKNALNKKYEIEVPRLIGLDAPGMTMDSVPDASQFVVLKHGEVYSVVRVFNSYIGADPDDHNSRPLGRDNLLQLVVLTWYYPRASNVKWRDQWQPKGYLWSDPITSIAMPFKIEKNAPVVNCP